MENKTRTFLRSFVFMTIVMLQSAMALDTQVAERTDFLRQRLQRLETRLFEEITLLRQEFYFELESMLKLSKHGGNAMENKSEPAFETELQNFKKDFKEKMRNFMIGLSDEKRVRRAIQDELNSLNENMLCQKKAMEDTLKNLKQLTADLVDNFQRDRGNISHVINNGIDKLIDGLDLHDELNEIVEILKVKKDRQVSMEINGDTVKKVIERITDCADWRRRGHVNSGVYTVFPETIWRPLKVYCDMETAGGGWTVFQRRNDGSVDFNRNWMNYTYGFGDLSGEFWLGNEFLHRLTSLDPQELRIELEDFDNDRRFAEYGEFSVGPAQDFFKLSVDFFRGSITDSLISAHHGKGFSTADRGPSTGCSNQYKGGWWYGNCHAVNINGLYLKGNHTTYADGVNWYHWKGHHYSLKFTEMKFRSK